MKFINHQSVAKSIKGRLTKNKFAKVVFLSSVLLSLLVLGVLLGRILIQGLPHLDWQLFKTYLLVTQGTLVLKQL